MKKTPMAVALVLVFGLFATAVSLGPAMAQYTGSNTTSTGNQTSTTGTGTNATGTGTNATGSNQTSTAAEGSTFSASGRIAAIIYDVPESDTTGTASDTSNTTSSNMTSSNMTSDSALSSSNTTMSQTVTGGNETSMSGNLTSSNTTGTSSDLTSSMNETTTAADEAELPYIVAGDWSLDVQDGNVTDFTANFTMVHTDGTSRHTHDVSNFQASNGSSVQLEQDGVTFIFGTTDIMTNGSSGWTGVDTLIVIENANAASITFSTEDDHFKGQPLYGVVDSLTDESGEQMIQTQTAQEGNATGNATGIGDTLGGAANQTGDFLGDIGESLSNMTGIGQ